MARPKLGDTETERLHMKLTLQEREQIDEWRFENRIASRSEAVRRLCQIGILTDNELEPIVDMSTNCILGMIQQLRDGDALYRQLTSGPAEDVLFGKAEMLEVLTDASERFVDAINAVEGLHSMIVGLYNALLPFIESDTILRGAEESRKRIDEANKAMEIAFAKAEDSYHNRYIVINHDFETPEQRQHYENLSDEEQEAYLNAALEALKQEEAADPEAFKEKYNLKRFWEKSGWLARLPKRPTTPETEA